MDPIIESVWKIDDGNILKISSQVWRLQLIRQEY